MAHLSTIYYRRSGYSLTEIAIVLGVVGILLGGIWGLGNYAYESAKREQMVEYIRVVVQKTRVYGLKYPNLVGNSPFNRPRTMAANGFTDELIRADVVPREMVVNRDIRDGSPLQNAQTPWGTNFKITNNTEVFEIMSSR